MKLLLKAVAPIVMLGALSSDRPRRNGRRTEAAGVPKTADGKPDLTAPAPRTADGKPDFSGNWIRGDGQLGPAGGGTLPGPPRRSPAGLR